MPYRSWILGITSAALFVIGLGVLVYCFITRKDPEKALVFGNRLTRKSLAMVFVFMGVFGGLWTSMTLPPMVSCYKPAPGPAVRYAMGKWEIAIQLELLKELSADGKLTPKTVEAASEAIKDSLEMMQETKLNQEEYDLFAKQTLDTLEKSHEAVAAQVENLKKVNSTFIDARNMAKNAGKESHQQRLDMEKRIAETKKLIAKMVKTGQLTKVKAELLCGLLDDLQADFSSVPPYGVMCYKMMPNQPVVRSFRQIEKRLEVIDKLVDNGKATPELRKIIILNLEDDYSILSDKNRLKRFPKRDFRTGKMVEKKHVSEMRQRCKAAIDKLKKQNEALERE